MYGLVKQNNRILSFQHDLRHGIGRRTNTKALYVSWLFVALFNVDVDLKSVIGR